MQRYNQPPLIWDAKFLISMLVRAEHMHRGVARRGGGGGNFVSHFLSKQPTIGGENDMKTWWVPSFWHSVIPA